MNTKGMKFLTVLAVLAMAFAAFAVIAPAEQNDASGTVTIVSEINTSQSIGTAGKYYVSADATVTITAALASATEFYVETGKVLTLNGTMGAATVTFYTVTGSVSGTTLTYTASSGATFAVANSCVFTDFVYTAGTFTNAVYDSASATVSGSASTAITSAGTNNMVSIAAGKTLVSSTVPTNATGINYGVMIYNGTNYTFQPTSYTTDFSLTSTATTATVKAYSGTLTIYGSDGTTKDAVVNMSSFVSNEGGMKFTYTNTAPTVEGTIVSGALTLKSGTLTATATTVVITNGATFTAFPSEFSAATATSATVANNTVMASAPSATYDCAYGAVYTTTVPSAAIALNAHYSTFGAFTTTAAATVVGCTFGAFTTSNTLTATDSTFTSVTSTDVTDAITLTDTTIGTLTVYSGAASVTATANLSGFTGIITTGDNNGTFATINVNTNITGSITLSSGSFQAAANELAIGKKGTSTTFTVGKNAYFYGPNQAAATIKLAKDCSFVLYGVLYKTGATSLSVVQNAANDEGTFTAYSGARLGDFVYIKLDADNMTLTSALKDIEVSGELNSTIPYNQLQNVVIIGDLSIGEGKSVSILGKLTVKEGKTLTIEKDAKLIIGATDAAATVTVNSTVMEVDGTIEVQKDGGLYLTSGNGFDFKGTLETDGTTYVKAETNFKSGSKLIVETDGTLSLQADKALSIKSGARMTVEGILTEKAASSFGLNVAGTLTIDGTVTPTTAFNIYMVGNGATLNFTEMKFGAAANVYVKDVGTVLYKSDGTSKLTVEANKGNMITLIPNAVNNKIYGLVVKQTAYVYTYSGSEYMSSKLDLSGSVGATTAVDVDIELDYTEDTDTFGGFTVSGILSLGEGVQFTNDNASNASLTISGEMYNLYTTDSVALAAVDGSGVPLTTVTGKLVVVDKDTITKINAAYYSVYSGGVTTHVYTSFEDAVAGAATASLEKFEVLGTITISESIEIPSPIEVKATDATINVGSTSNRNVVLTVDDGAKLSLGTANVYGSLVFENYNTGKKSSDTIVSDVYTELGTSRTYTNIYTALADPEVGSVVQITKDTDPVELNTSLTIPAGVTVVASAGQYIKLDDGVILTVNGTLSSWEALKVDDGTVFTSAATLASTGEVKMVVNGLFASVAAADYSTFDESIAGAYYTYTDDDATYNCISSLAVASTLIDDKAKTINVYGKQAFGAVTIAGDYKITVNLTSTADITSADLTLKKAKVVATGAKEFNGTITSEEGSVKFTKAKGFTVSSESVSGTYELLLLGTISKGTGSSSSSTMSTSIASGDVYVSGAVVIGSITVAQGATLHIEGTGNSMTNSGTTTINGALVVDDAGVYTAAKAVVMGTLTVNNTDASAGTSAGIASVTELYIGQKVSETYSTSGTGAVVAPAISSLAIVFLTDGSTISDEVVEGMVKSTFVVEGETYLTVYAASNSTYYARYVLAPELDDSTFVCWQYTSSGKTYDVGEDYPGALTTARTYTAYIAYEIYSITVTTDAGIKAVAIDGVEMYTVGGNQFFSLKDITAGTHTITYTLKSGYEETTNGVQLYTEDGTILQSLKFTTSGTDDDDFDVNLLLKGTQQIVTPEPVTPEEKSEWTITTILLVILVILIAVMAVIVALRLNRN